MESNEANSRCPEACETAASLALNAAFGAGLFIYALDLAVQARASLGASEAPLCMDVQYWSLVLLAPSFYLMAVVLLVAAFRASWATRLAPIAANTLWLPFLVITVYGTVILVAQVRLSPPLVGLPWVPWVFFGWVLAYWVHFFAFRHSTAVRRGAERILRWVFRLPRAATAIVVMLRPQGPAQALLAGFILILVVVLIAWPGQVWSFLLEDSPAAALVTALAGGLVVFLLGGVYRVTAKTWQGVKLSKAFGLVVKDSNAVVCYGQMTDSRVLRPNPPPNRYVKIYSNGTQVPLPGPWGYIASECEVRATSYFASQLAGLLRDPVPVEGDSVALHNLSRTVFSLGSGASNEISARILSQPENTFADFRSLPGAFCLYVKPAHIAYVGFQTAPPKDYGLILKLPNRLSPDTYLCLCAGLGEWGTSGAAWYLSQKWWQLHQELGNTYGLVVEVTVGQDESARRVWP